MRASSVGMKCPNCAAVPRRATRIGKTRHKVAACAAGLAVATGAGAILVLVPFGSFILPIFVGYAVGQSVVRAAHRQSHAPIKVIAVVTTVLGLVLGPILVELFQGIPPEFIVALLPAVIRSQAVSILIAAVFAFVSVGR